MVAPVLTPAGGMIWRLLPDYVREADEATDWTTRRIVGAIAVGFDPAVDLLNLADPDTSVSGTNELANPEAIPRAWLPWLGWLLGIDVAALPVEYAREIVAATGVAQRRGTRAAIAAAVARTLSSPTPAPRVYSGQASDPLRITVLTSVAQTPDPAASLAAANTEKPAGAVIYLNTVVGVVIADYEDAFPSITAYELALPTLAAVDAWTL